MIYIGIDPGQKTGIAIWDSVNRTLKHGKPTAGFTDAWEIITQHNPAACRVVIEDNRKYPVLLKKITGNKKINLQRAAKIGRNIGQVDARVTILEELLLIHGYKYELYDPRVQRTTKIDAAYYARLTGFNGVTNEHQRDAGMMVFGRK